MSDKQTDTERRQRLFGGGQSPLGRGSGGGLFTPKIKQEEEVPQEEKPQETDDEKRARLGLTPSSGIGRKKDQ